MSDQPASAPQSRPVHFFSASSLDGFIAGLNGDISWLYTDADYGFAAFAAGVDTVLVGRKTYEVCVALEKNPFPGMKVIVFSRSPRPEGTPLEVSWTAEAPAAVTRRLIQQEGRGIWMVGGAELASCLLREGMIDRWVISLHPILLGEGIPLFAPPFPPVSLRLEHSQSHPSGLVQLTLVKP